jgi:hypothetical protein
MKAKNIVENKSDICASNSIAPKPEKEKYSSPELKVYGSVNLLTKNGTGSGTDGGTTSGMTKQSDRATKESIVRIGDHPLGIGLYLFDYKPEFRGLWGHGRQFGVMADEVESVMPEAVSMHLNGYKMVDYSLLDISRTVH